MDSMRRSPIGKSSREYKRGPWNQTEDALLQELVQKYEVGSWVKISQGMHNRTPKQCRERWHQNLDPILNHGPVTEEEGLFIEMQVATIGKKWAEIARMMNHRSDNAVKNWWNGGNNRRRRHAEEAAHTTATYLAPVHHHHHHPHAASSHHNAPPPVYGAYPVAANPMGAPSSMRPPPPSAAASRSDAPNFPLPAISVGPRNLGYEPPLISPAAPSLVSDHSDYTDSPAGSPSQTSSRTAYARPSSHHQHVRPYAGHSHTDPVIVDSASGHPVHPHQYHQPQAQPQQPMGDYALHPALRDDSSKSRDAGLFGGLASLAQAATIQRDAAAQSKGPQLAPVQLPSPPATASTATFASAAASSAASTPTSASRLPPMQNSPPATTASNADAIRLPPLRNLPASPRAKMSLNNIM